jgi:hypothetical protein
VLNPWRLVRERGQIVVHHVILPRGMQGATAGDDICLDRRLTQRQRRCTLMHELIHWEHDHEGHQPPAVEAFVDRLAAIALIDLPDLRDALLWAKNLWEAADHLFVTERILTVRVDNLTDMERTFLNPAT